MPIATKRGSFYAIGEAGIRYDSAYAPGHTEVEEVVGTRVVLKCTGACASQDGIEVLRYTMRMTTYADLPAIEISHTTIFTCNTKMYRFREIGLDLGLSTGIPFLVRQQSPDVRRIEPDAGQQAREIDRAGAFGFGGEGWNLAVAIRDLREKAPLELVSDVERGLSFLCWPDLTDCHPHRASDVRPAHLPRLPFAHQGPLLDFNMPPVYQTQATSQSAGYLRAGIAMGNAMGVARTHEFLLAFGERRAADPSGAARAYLKRPHVSATGQWMAETGAVGDLPMTPRGPADDTTVAGRAEAVLDRNFDWEMRKLAPVSPGKWTWGAAHSQWVERAGYWSSWRLFRNTHHGATKGYWYLFARSADPKYLAFARRSTEFVADVGMCHYADTDLRHLNYYGKIVGAVCDYKGYVPWHSGSRFGYNTYADFLINWHYLTGHPRAKDTLDELFRFYLRARRGGAGSSRPGASRMETACSLYAHTLDGRLLRYINNSLTTPKGNQSDVGFIPAGKEFGTWLPYYLNLTADPAALDVLERWAYADLKQPWWYDFDGKNWQPNWATQAYAYYCFRDPALLGPALARLERHVLDAAFLQEGHPEDGFIKAGNTAWSWLQQKIPSFLWALEDAGDAARPHYATETFSAFILDDVWSTWAVLDRQPGTIGDRRFHIRLRGRWQAEGEPTMQLVAANGKVIHRGLLPKFSWQQLGLSNRPIHPEEALLEVDPGRTPGPYYLQARGQGGSVMVMLPLSTLPREVYHAGDNVRRHVTSFMKDPGRFPQLAQLQSQHQWFNACYGWRKLYFRVPKQGDRLDCYGVHGGFGLYKFHIEDPAGSRVVSEAGFNRTKFHAERIEGSQLATLRGQLAVFDAPCEKPRLYLILGADIPPFVSLTPEAFFVPELCPDEVRAADAQR